MYKHHGYMIITKIIHFFMNKSSNTTGSQHTVSSSELWISYCMYLTV